MGMTTSEEKIVSVLDNILKAQAASAERQEELAATVASLAEQVAHMADLPSGATVAPDISHIKFKNAPDHLPLIPVDPENTARRVNLAVMLQILGSEPGAELIRHGARGFYRKLNRDEGAERIELRRDIALALVEDALLEDADEAAEMSRDLLCIWEPEDAADFRSPPMID